MAKQKDIIMDGSWSLSDLEREIRFQEAASWELKKLAVAAPNSPDNRATFSRLPIGDQPNDIHLVLSSDPAPANTDELFECSIMVESASTDVTVYRDK